MKLYHATWPNRLESICDEGLRSPTYFANEPHYAAGFLRMRGHEIVGVRTLVHEGVEHRIPDMVVHDEIAVLEVDSERLKPVFLEEVEDHASAFYPDDLVCYIYDTVVPADLVVVHSVFANKESA